MSGLLGSSSPRGSSSTSCFFSHQVVVRPYARAIECPVIPSRPSSPADLAFLASDYEKSGLTFIAQETRAGSATKPSRRLDSCTTLLPGSRRSRKLDRLRVPQLRRNRIPPRWPRFAARVESSFRFPMAYGAFCYGVGEALIHAIQATCSLSPRSRGLSSPTQTSSQREIVVAHRDRPQRS